VANKKLESTLNHGTACCGSATVDGRCGGCNARTRLVPMTAEKKAQLMEHAGNNASLNRRPFCADAVPRGEPIMVGSGSGSGPFGTPKSSGIGGTRF
jgi:hypothetical protein